MYQKLSHLVVWCNGSAYLTVSQEIGVRFPVPLPIYCGESWAQTSLISWSWTDRNRPPQPLSRFITSGRNYRGAARTPTAGSITLIGAMAGGTYRLIIYLKRLSLVGVFFIILNVFVSSLFISFLSYCVWWFFFF